MKRGEEIVYPFPGTIQNGTGKQLPIQLLCVQTHAHLYILGICLSIVGKGTVQNVCKQNVSIVMTG